MTDTTEPPTAVVNPDAWRRLSLPAKIRYRWRLRARKTQLTPGPHHLCTAEDCDQLLRDALQLYPRRREADQRYEWLVQHGHIPWSIWLILAGRGWGKTRTGAEDIVKYMLENPGHRIALIAPTFSDGRDTMVEGESGILALLPKSLILTWNRSIGELVLTNGARAKIFSSEEPERLRGPQHHRAWCDELAAWRYLQGTWDQMMFGLRLGQNPQVIITTTPKPYRFLRKLVLRAIDPKEGIIVTKGFTTENAANLARTTLKALRDTYEGTRLGRQELNAEILEEDEDNQLFKAAIFDELRVGPGEMPDPQDSLVRIVVAIDPAVSEKRTSDETGMVVAGLTITPCPFCTREDNPDGNQHAIVLEDATPGRVGPLIWADRAIRAYTKWKADRVIAEVNNGGDLVEANLRAVAPNLPVKQVRASRGKIIRAEPVAALYEKRKVHHYGYHERLERQMVQLGSDPEDPDKDVAESENESASPDRADACVWALTELMVPPEAYVATTVVRDRRGVGSR